MIEDADKDGTGTLDIIEFLQMMREKVKEQNKEDEEADIYKINWRDPRSRVFKALMEFFRF